MSGSLSARSQKSSWPEKAGHRDACRDATLSGVLASCWSKTNISMRVQEGASGFSFLSNGIITSSTPCTH
ncbi:hypothetical protein M408DRAFT_332476 [Serendipita vermifera MAFF 305830]|uniref:Uncharacterized protein n=1 Tax=Serendipita vermifera MAFF 305830 TaxID=933852 RepID=A0A0C2X110_SERVB|nr:hypothetical protein M408DRAFT_332476 [Serendipita vermifera MAFF 305830]